MNILDENELDLQFDAILSQIVEIREIHVLRNMMDELSLQKLLFERELIYASSDILGRFAKQIWYDLHGTAFPRFPTQRWRTYSRKQVE